MTNLRPCPFCEKQMDTSYSLKADDKTRVICWQCGAEGELSEWSKRPIEDKLIANSERLAELICGAYESGKFVGWTKAIEAHEALIREVKVSDAIQKTVSENTEAWKKLAEK